MTGDTTKKLEIRLFATLRNHRSGSMNLECAAGAPIGAILDQLNIPETDAAIILVNGRHGDLDTVPEDGDVVALFPPVGGG